MHDLHRRCVRVAIARDHFDAEMLQLDDDLLAEFARAEHHDPHRVSRQWRTNLHPRLIPLPPTPTARGCGRSGLSHCVSEGYTANSLYGRPRTTPGRTCRLVLGCSCDGSINVASCRSC